MTGGIEINLKKYAISLKKSASAFLGSSLHLLKKLSPKKNRRYHL